MKSKIANVSLIRLTDLEVISLNAILKSYLELEKEDRLDQMIDEKIESILGKLKPSLASVRERRKK